MEVEEEEDNFNSFFIFAFFLLLLFRRIISIHTPLFIELFLLPVLSFGASVLSVSVFLSVFWFGLVLLWRESFTVLMALAVRLLPVLHIANSIVKH